MFEPRPFSDRSSAQDDLIIALKNRDLEAFEEALADPAVDPDYWYGKPYWSTCLQLAAKTDGCEAFVLALLRAGAGQRRCQRNTSQSAPLSLNGIGDGEGLSQPVCLVCAAQGRSSAVGSVGAEGTTDSTGVGSGLRPETWTSNDAMAAQSPTPPLDSSDHQTTLFWLRDLGRSFRTMSEHIGTELRTLSTRIEELDGRLGAVERAQENTNNILNHHLR